MIQKQSSGRFHVLIFHHIFWLLQMTGLMFHVPSKYKKIPHDSEEGVPPRKKKDSKLFF